MPTTLLTVVLPVAQLSQFQAQQSGWTSGRTNGVTQTLAKEFPSQDDALAFAKKNLKRLIYSFETVRTVLPASV